MDFFVAKTRSDSKDPCQGTPSSRQQPLRKSPGEDCKIPTRGTPVARGRQSIDCNYVEEASKCEISNHAPVKSLLSSHHTFHDPRLGVTLPSLQHYYQADDRRFWKTAFVLEKHSVHFREKHSQYRGGLLAGNTGPHQTQRKENKKKKQGTIRINRSHGSLARTLPPAGCLVGPSWQKPPAGQDRVLFLCKQHRSATGFRSTRLAKTEVCLLPFGETQRRPKVSTRSLRGTLHIQ